MMNRVYRPNDKLDICPIATSAASHRHQVLAAFPPSRHRAHRGVVPRPPPPVLQSALNRVFTPLEVTGHLDELTEARIRARQAVTGRSVTGIADLDLLESLTVPT